jgi:FAD/FMN-containing dehydrogenase
MAEFAEEGVYVNFVAEPSAEAIKAGFGDDKYARMVAVKDKYDPDNVFKSNTNIPPSAAASA